MDNRKNRNSSKASKDNVQPEFYNDQLGENAGEGRVIKKQEKKKNCHNGI
jgi:hypothetical protein